MKLIKDDLQVKKPSWKILKLLNKIDFKVQKLDWKPFDIEVFPLYNGRERSFCLQCSALIGSYREKALFICFGENRNSDNIFLQHNRADKPFNAPTNHEVFSEDSYYSRKYFMPDSEEKVASEIQVMVQNFIDEVYAEAATRELEKKAATV